MPHLTLEALARLVDEAPTDEELRHLEGCEYCSGELEALRTQTDSLAALPKMTPPPDLWPEIKAGLRREGLVATTPRRVSPTLTRLAAALAVFIAGSATGFVARGTVPGAPTGSQEAPMAAAEAQPVDAAPDASSPAPAPSTAYDLASGDVTADMERAQDMFAAALDRYMRANSTPAPDPAARLAALDNIVLTTAEALNESPADPVINSYHLTAVAQRNELLRQIAATGEPVF